MPFEREALSGRPTIGAALILLLAFSAPGLGEERVTLEQALREARAANAHLPLPALEMTVAGEREKEARAERWLK